MAGSSSGGGGGPKKARIEIIPLIDVIFFLLATFVLFTLALNKSNGLPVSLPDSVTGGKRDPAGSRTVTIKQEGTLAWEKDPVTLQEFLDRLKQYKYETAEPMILINGDKYAYFNRAIYVFDEVRKAGIQKVYIETLMSPESASSAGNK